MTERTTTTRRGRVKARPRRSGMARREDIAGRVLVSPTLFILTLVVLLPFLAALLFAFQEFRLIDLANPSRDTTWTLDNFRGVLTSSGFWSALRVTVVYSVLSTVGAVVTGLVVALALRNPFPGRGLLRGLVLIPYVLPVVAAVMIWEQLLNTQYGLINAFGRKYLGWDAPISFLSQESLNIAGVNVPVALTVVILFEIWKTFPLAYLFISARLTAASGELEEAALIDGATPTQQLWYVLLPQLAGTMLLMGVLRFIWSFQSFNEIYLLTGGAGGTQVLAVRVYQQLTTRGDIGSSSALGIVMMLMLSVVLLFYVRRTQKEVADS